MANRPTKPGLASEWPGFPSAAAAANPLETIGLLVETATSLAAPGSHAVPDNIDDLVEAATSLAPPDTPAGGGAGDSSVTEDGVRLGAGAAQAIEPAGHASEAAGLLMTLDGDAVFLITVGIGHAMDAAL